jgi:hypothetical protein
MTREEFNISVFTVDDGVLIIMNADKQRGNVRRKNDMSSYCLLRITRAFVQINALNKELFICFVQSSSPTIGGFTQNADNIRFVQLQFVWFCGCKRSDSLHLRTVCTSTLTTDSAISA